MTYKGVAMKTWLVSAKDAAGKVMYFTPDYGWTEDRQIARQFVKDPGPTISVFQKSAEVNQLADVKVEEGPDL